MDASILLRSVNCNISKNGQYDDIIKKICNYEDLIKVYQILRVVTLMKLENV